jgi:hypothetical protein
VVEEEVDDVVDELLVDEDVVLEEVQEVEDEVVLDVEVE